MSVRRHVEVSQPAQSRPDAPPGGDVLRIAQGDGLDRRESFFEPDDPLDHVFIAPMPPPACSAICRSVALGPNQLADRYPRFR